MRKNKVKMLIFIPDSYPDKGKNTVHGQGIHFSLVQDMMLITVDS